MTKFDFTEEELQSNKKGILSPRQKGWLDAMAGAARKDTKNGVWIILGFSALGLCIIIPLNMQGLDARSLQTLGPQLLAGLCLIVVAVLAMIALIFFVSRRQAAKLESAQLLSVEGVVRHDSSYSEQGGFTSYYVYFGKKRFAYADDLSHIFPEGAKFRVYYSKAGQTELIMSYEKLS